MKRKNRDVVWVVVYVHEGVIYAVEAYRDKMAAESRREFYLKEYNREEDDLDVYEVGLGVPST